MASFWNKLGTVGLGAAEGTFKGGLTGALIGGTLFGVPAATLGVGLGFLIKAGLTAAAIGSAPAIGIAVVLGGAATLGLGALGFMSGASLFAPYTAAYGLITKPFKRLREANQQDLEGQKAELANAKLDYQRTLQQNSQLASSMGYASSDNASEVPHAAGGRYQFDNPDAKTGHLDRLRSQEGLSANQFMSAGKG
jgi:hypothetical protein